jgi:hypothetical protein
MEEVLKVVEIRKGQHKLLEVKTSQKTNPSTIRRTCKAKTPNRRDGTALDSDVKLMRHIELYPTKRMRFVAAKSDCSCRLKKKVNFENIVINLHVTPSKSKVQHVDRVNIVVEADCKVWSLDIAAEPTQIVQCFNAMQSLLADSQSGTQ